MYDSAHVLSLEVASLEYRIRDYDSRITGSGMGKVFFLTNPYTDCGVLDIECDGKVIYATVAIRTPEDETVFDSFCVANNEHAPREILTKAEDCFVGRGYIWN